MVINLTLCASIKLAQESEVRRIGKIDREAVSRNQGIPKSEVGEC